MTESTKKQLVENMVESLPMLRKTLKMSQSDLADFLGNSRHTVTNIENKKRPMMWNTFLSLILLFENNEETLKMLEEKSIYTGELKNMIYRNQ